MPTISIRLFTGTSASATRTPGVEVPGAAAGAEHPCPNGRNLLLFPPYLFPRGLGAVSPKSKSTRDSQGWIYPTPPLKTQCRILTKPIVQRKDAQSSAMGFGLLDFGGYELRHWRKTTKGFATAP